MAGQNWVSLLNPDSPRSSGAGTALSTAATATISPVGGTAAFADVAQVNPEGQYLGWKPGLVIRVTARGFVTTTATSTTATFLLAARVGNTGSTYVTLATSAGIATSTTVLTGAQIRLEALIRCTACATSGNTVSTQGEMSITTTAAQTIGTATAQVVVGLPNASGETAAAVDTTQIQGISMRATLAGANATIQLTEWLVEALN